MKKTLLTVILIIAAIALATVASATRTGRQKAAASQAAAETAAQKIQRGEYLVTIGGCNDCHTPWIMGPNGPQPDETRMLSGHPADVEMPPAPGPSGPWQWTAAETNTAFAGPWGVSFARNLTPDQQTGIGIWTEEMFIKTIRSGQHWGVSRPILPPMPWFNYAKMSDDDLKAVYAYLRSVKPVENQVPDAILAPPPAAPGM